MDLLHHIRTCNEFAADRFLPLVHDGAAVGLLRRDNAALLQRISALFRDEGERVVLAADGGFEAVSAAVDGVVERLVAAGVLPRWRNEFFAVAPRWGAPAQFRLDRGAVPFFGTRAYGVHLNGYRRDRDGLKLWIGRRAADKPVAPDKLDNLVAGGIAWQHSLGETLVKEAAEEAAIPASLIAQAMPVGAVSYRMETALGVRNDVLFVHDLEVPADFVPRNTDGELAAFSLMDAAAVLALVRAGDAFKFNVNLVIIDFALRRGLVTPEDDNYLDLVTGLHRPLN